MPAERITSWRSGDIAGIELRLGVAVAEPYPRHWHEELQLCLATDGGGLLHYRGAAHVTPKASLFVVHPGEIHANEADRGSGCSFRSMYIPAELIRRIARDLAGRPRDLPFFPRPVVLDQDIVALFVELHRTLEAPGARLAAESRLLELFVRLIGRHSADGQEPAPAGRERAAVRRVREFLATAYSDNISLDELAGLAGLSPFHLSRVFRREVGMPPHAYQTQLRILKAKALIRAGRQLADVAAATGFVDQSHFARHFRWLVKLTPGRYSRASKNVQDRPRAAG